MEYYEIADRIISTTQLVKELADKPLLVADVCSAYYEQIVVMNSLIMRARKLMRKGDLVNQ